MTTTCFDVKLLFWYHDTWSHSAPIAYDRLIVSYRFSYLLGLGIRWNFDMLSKATGFDWRSTYEIFPKISTMKVTREGVVIKFCSRLEWQFLSICFWSFECHFRFCLSEDDSIRKAKEFENRKCAAPNLLQECNYRCRSRAVVRKVLSRYARRFWLFLQSVIIKIVLWILISSNSLKR